MKESEQGIQRTDPTLYNEDLAPLPHDKRNWGAFEIFNVWSNDIQSLFGYTLAASLFLTYGLNGWNIRALVAFGSAALFSLSTVLVPASPRYWCRPCPASTATAG